MPTPPDATPAPAPSDSNYQPPGPPYIPPRDPRIDWLFKGIGAIALAAVVGMTGWVFGGLHERLDKAEDKIHDLDKVDTKFDAKLERLSEETKKQWELISKNSQGISALGGQ